MHHTALCKLQIFMAIQETMSCFGDFQSASIQLFNYQIYQQKGEKKTNCDPSSNLYINDGQSYMYSKAATYGQGVCKILDDQTGAPDFQGGVWIKSVPGFM